MIFKINNKENDQFYEIEVYKDNLFIRTHEGEGMGMSFIEFNDFLYRAIDSLYKIEF